MTDKEQIAEMVSEINKVVNDNIELVTRKYATLEAEFMTRGMGVNFNSVGFAEALSNAGYRKIHEDEIVLTKEEYERLKALPEKVHEEMTERLKEEVAIEKRMGEDKLERFENNMKNVLEIEKENIRKEMATEILNDISKAIKVKEDIYGREYQIIYEEEIFKLKKKLKEKYGVEVKQ